MAESGVVHFDLKCENILLTADPALDLTGAGKGHIYINGFDAGRYWVRNPVLSTYYQLPPDNLLHKGNQLVLWEEMGATLKHVRVVRRAAAALS